MVKLDDHTVMIGATELRTEMPKLTRELANHKVIVTSRGKPVAVLEDFATYNQKEKFLDEFEDWIAGHIAKERFENSTPENYIDLKTLKKRLQSK